MIEVDGKNYWLFKTEFDNCEPAVVYIEDYKTYGEALDIERIARAWETNGFSLHLKAQNRLEDLASQTFKDLSVAMLKAVKTKNPKNN